ncbi:MAG TPA: PDZ domain-containing protein [Planctomycetaceae bacterium]|nr:PDZ domain-containing protein [Planctomycetaceae bacterium]
MKIRDLFAVVAAAAGLAGNALFGQEAAVDAGAAQPAPAADSGATPAAAAAAPLAPANAAADRAIDYLLGSNTLLVQGNTGKRVTVGLLTHGNTFGVEVAPAGDALRAQLGLDAEAGLVVTNVTPDSAAARAGLTQHDIVLKLGDEAVASPERFNELISSRQGQETTFHLLRQGKPVEWKVTIPNVPVYGVQNWGQVATAAPHYRVGVTLAEADETLRSQLKLAAGEGLVVTEIVADSPAAKAGLQRHDVLTKLDNQRLTTVEKINAQIQEIKDRQAAVEFLRGGEELSCNVAPKLSSEPASSVWVPVHGVWNVNDWNVTTFSGQNVPYRLHWLPADDPLRTSKPWLYSLHAAQASAPQPPPADAAAQVAALKRQVAEMSKMLESLEAALQPAEQQPEQQGRKPDPGEDD